jgi:hypothetical protein
MVLGFGLMIACLLALHGVTDARWATPLLALASASWTLPTVNAYPLFVEPVPPARAESSRRCSCWRWRWAAPSAIR